LRIFKKIAIFTDMETMEGLTIKEIAERLGIQRKAVQKRLEAAQIKPKEFAGKTAIYDLSVVAKIEKVRGKGRPPKVDPEEPKRKPGKAKR
jgi:transposase